MERNELALAAKQGDTKALDDLLRGFDHDVRCAAAKLVGNARTIDLDDLCQAAYVLLLEALASWEPAKSPFEAYARMRLKFKLRTELLRDTPYYVATNVAGAVRQIRAMEGEGTAVEVEAIAGKWDVNPEALRDALALDNDLDALLADHFQSEGVYL